MITPKQHAIATAQLLGFRIHPASRMMTPGPRSTGFRRQRAVCGIDLRGPRRKYFASWKAAMEWMVMFRQVQKESNGSSHTVLLNTVLSSMAP